MKGIDVSIYNGFIDWRSLGCPIWNAQWGKRDDLRGFLWQFTDRLKIANSFFDGNILYD
ncbi:MAG: hypothetical protein SR3Q1_12215 [Quinella sp. 3Q1]|nr:hypothetical protein [Quinella sp. 3Q1]MBR6887254.1 hypothetical protein [Selenomonadaceae bacterium]